MLFILDIIISLTKVTAWGRPVVISFLKPSWFYQLDIFMASLRSGYRPWCFRSAALVGGYSDEGKGHTAVLAYEGRLAEAKKVPVTRTVQFKGQNKIQPHHVRHTDTNFDDPKTSAWLMKPLRRDALLGSAKLKGAGVRSYVKS
eukprot:465523-Pelagomonas_calceolata.AAC.1